MAPGETLLVEVVHCPAPGVSERMALRVAVGTTLGDALKASGLMERQPRPWPGPGVRVGVWGKVKDAATVLRDGDRVEIYRPLQVDPKEARRRRAARAAAPARG